MLVSSFKPLCIFSLCRGFCKKKGNLYVFKFQTCSKYVRLIVPNEIMKLNRKNWCEILFSCTPHFGQIRFETVAFSRWNFLLLIQLKDNKKFQRGFKMHCNFHDAINAIVFQKQYLQRICFQLLNRRLVVLREIENNENLWGAKIALWFLHRT